jgi:hypothetical protein
MDLHIYIRRDDAIEARKAHHGHKIVRVDDEWLSARTEDELRYLASHGADDKDPLNNERYRDHQVRQIPLVEATPEAVALWLRQKVIAIAERAAEQEQKQDRERREALERWERKAKAYSEPADLVYNVTSTGYSVREVLSEPYTLKEEVIAEAFPELHRRLKGLVAEAEVLGKQRQNECAEAARQAEEKRKQERAAFEAERLAWIAEHGSQHLKELVELGFGFAQTYREERTDLELAGDAPFDRAAWTELSELCGEIKPIRDPDAAAIAALKTARKRWPAAQLGWINCQLQEGHDKDDFDDEGAIHIGAPCIHLKCLDETFCRVL